MAALKVAMRGPKRRAIVAVIRWRHIRQGEDRCRLRALSHAGHRRRAAATLEQVVNGGADHKAASMNGMVCVPVHLIACIHEHGARAVGAAVPRARNREVIVGALCAEECCARCKVLPCAHRAGLIVAICTGAISDASSTERAKDANTRGRNPARWRRLLPRQGCLARGAA